MNSNQRAIPIFAYHRVHADDDPLLPEVRTDLFCGHVTLSAFRKQMAALAERGFTTISQDQLAQWLCDGQALPEGKVVAIGFDDNRLNVLENALPVMSEYGFKATVWVISRLADGNLPDYETYPWLNWDQLAQLHHEQGWEIGAHTATHPFAPWLIRGTDGPDGARRYMDNLIECNDAIERHIGIKPQHFAYPGGEWNDHAEALVVRLYKTARHWECDDRPYYHNTWYTNPYRLQAINVSMQMSHARYVQILDAAE